jgi:hypothetical protein
MAFDASHGPRAVAAAIFGCVLCLAWFAVSVDERILTTLAALLAVSALAANLASARYGQGLWVSASFTCSVVAIGLLGPAAAFAVVAIAEVAAVGDRALPPDRRGDQRRRDRAAEPPRRHAARVARASGTSDLRLAVALVLLSGLALLLNFFCHRPADRAAWHGSAHRLVPPRQLLPTLLWSVAVASRSR